MRHECTKQTLARLRPGGTGGPGLGYERSGVAGPEHLNPWRAGRFSLDHLVGGYEQLIGHCEAERLRGGRIDGQLEFHRLLDRQVGRFFAFENPPDVATGEAVAIGNARSVTDQPTNQSVR
jgi:hypothetical protein